MAKIKLTKNELKAQREALARYERFLPILQLKKQQLQLEIQTIDAKIAEKRSREKKVWEKLSSWIKLFGNDDESEQALQMVSVESVVSDWGNIAGVIIPVLTEIKLRVKEPDIFLDPPWYDDASSVLKELLRLRIELNFLERERQLIAEELRVISQRVNLFEKVKIPECIENIRIIKIFLGDQQTAAVVRGKIAKSRIRPPEDTQFSMEASL